MTAVLWKIPAHWTWPSLPDRAGLAPALHLRAAGTPTVIAREFSSAAWKAATARVLVSDGPLTEEERMLIVQARAGALVLLPQGGLSRADREFAEASGRRIVVFTDAGPLGSAPLGPAWTAVTGSAARAAEDVMLAAALEMEPPSPPAAPPEPGQILVAVSGLAAFTALRPVLPRDGAPLIVTSEDKAALAAIAADGFPVIGAGDPTLLKIMQAAQTVLCAHGDLPPDSPRPGQWARTALLHGAPVVAASHPSLDGLAHLCVLDDWERGLALYSRAPVERMKAVARGQAFLLGQLESERIAGEWTALLDPRARPARRKVGRRDAPILLTLIDIHQDVDVLLPILLALKQRGDVGLRIVVSDWLVEGSPRALNLLTAHGLAFQVLDRQAIRRGDVPSLGGVKGTISAADTGALAHKAGHTLNSRARTKGLPTFTVQHGFEQLGLTYADDLHGRDTRFAAETIFTWGPPEGLADWVPAETRAAAVPIGSPKAMSPPAAGPHLGQGYSQVAGVFENLHWARFDDDYRERFLADLAAVAEGAPDTLFLVKPHHAGRWLVRNRERLPTLDNLFVIDPTDPAWEPHTAPALIAGMDAVLTTPSTVAMDAVRAGKPTAVIGYELDLRLYDPLTIIRERMDWRAFLDARGAAHLKKGEAFLNRSLLPGQADHRIAARIEAALLRKAKGSRGFRFGWPMNG